MSTQRYYKPQNEEKSRKNETTNELKCESFKPKRFKGKFRKGKKSANLYQSSIHWR